MEKSPVFISPEQRLHAAVDRAGAVTRHMEIQIFNLDPALFQLFPDGIPKCNICDADLRVDGHPVVTRTLLQDSLV